MNRRRMIRRAGVLACLIALLAPLGAQATQRSPDNGNRLFYATDGSGNLVSFRLKSPRNLRSVTPITGLPAGVSLKGIDFRPATGDLYGVGSDSVVYRLNPFTGIAIAEGPAFTPSLNGSFFGLDFNPTVDKIRVTSDANQNLRLDPDPGSVLGNDAALNPGDPAVVGSAYTNSSFTATKPTATTLYAVDSGVDMLFVQNPPNAGTLTQGKALGIDVGSDAGFDIAGSANTGYLVTQGQRGTTLYAVDLASGTATSLGRVGDGRPLTGLAAWQDGVVS